MTGKTPRGSRVYQNLLLVQPGECFCFQHLRLQREREMAAPLDFLCDKVSGRYR